MEEDDRLDTSKEEPSVRDTDGKENDNPTKHEEDVPSDDVDNDNVTEGIEVQENQESQSPQSSNIKQALKTMASVLWPRSTNGHFLSKTKVNHQNPSNSFPQQPLPHVHTQIMQIHLTVTSFKVWMKIMIKKSFS